MVKECVRAMQNEEGVLVIDDSSIEKLYTDENELNCWHYTQCTQPHIFPLCGQQVTPVENGS